MKKMMQKKQKFIRCRPVRNVILPIKGTVENVVATLMKVEPKKNLNYLKEIENW